MSPSFFEIVQLADGDYALRRIDDDAAPLVRISFSDEAREMLEDRDRHCPSICSEKPRPVRIGGTTTTIEETSLHGSLADLDGRSVCDSIWKHVPHSD